MARKDSPVDGTDGSPKCKRQASTAEPVLVGASSSVSGSGGDVVREEKVGEVLNNGDCESTSKSPVLVDKKEKCRTPVEKESKEEEDNARFLGDPVPDEEARQRWPHRYQIKNPVTFTHTHTYCVYKCICLYTNKYLYMICVSTFSCLFIFF